MIEVRYAGIVIGRTAVIRELDTRGLFLGITEPMPVGTPISLRIGDQTVEQAVQGKVEIVSESQDLAHAGMRVRFNDPQSAVLFGTPKEAPPEPDPPPVSLQEEPAPARASSAAASESSGAADGDDPSSGAATAALVSGSAPASVVGHRRIVVDASTEKPEADGMPDSPSGDGGDQQSAGVGVDDGARIPAPDPQAFGPGGAGRKGRRNKRR